MMARSNVEIRSGCESHNNFRTRTEIINKIIMQVHDGIARVQHLINNGISRSLDSLHKLPRFLRSENHEQR